MNIPDPKRLPSGNWRIQVLINGKRVGRTFPTAQEAIYWAAGVKTEQKAVLQQPKNMTLGAAIDRYIDGRTSVLSPSTITGYKAIRKKAFPDLMGIPLADLTQERVQRAVNTMSKAASAKSVKNSYGLVTATLAEFYPDLRLRTKLPQKQRADIVIPSEADIAAIMQAVKGKSVELPTLLSLWLGLRMSEIRGLTWDCIDGNTLHVKQALVDGGLKGTKTYTSNRYLPIPPYIKGLLDACDHTSEYIVPSDRRRIYYNFQKYTSRAGIKHYRFHDLRHANASVMLLLNVPDKYAMERMGHSTNNMLKTVYQHTMSAEQERIANVVNDYFSGMIAHEIAHEN